MGPRPTLKLSKASLATPTTTHFSNAPYDAASVRAVHFPPTPEIVVATHEAHPASVYDRAPIQVSPNMCALPRRGERVYTLFDARDCYRLHPVSSPFSGVAVESPVPSPAALASSPAPVHASFGTESLCSAESLPKTRSYDPVQSVRAFQSQPPSPVQDMVRKPDLKGSLRVLRARRGLEAGGALLALDDCLAGF